MQSLKCPCGKTVYAAHGCSGVVRCVACGRLVNIPVAKPAGK